MALDKSKVSSVRFMFLVTVFILSSSFLPSFSISVTKNESWLTMIFAGIVSLPILYLYRTIMVKFPDKNLIQVLRLVFGKVVGSILSALFVYYVLTLTALNLNDFIDFAKLSLMHTTPNIVLLLTTIVISVYATRGGFGVVTRYCGIYVFVKISILIASIIFLLSQIDINNLLPIFSLTFDKYIQSTHISATIPIGEMVVFLMITPNIDLKRKKAAKIWYLGFALGFFIGLIALMRDISVLGNAIDFFRLPSLVTYKLINIGTVLSRLEILLSTGLVILLYFKVSLLLYISTISIAELFNLKDYKHIALSVGVLMALYSTTLYPNGDTHLAYVTNITPFVWLVAEIVIPLLALIYAYIRKLPHNYGRVVDLYSNSHKVKKIVYDNQYYKRRKVP